MNRKTLAETQIHPDALKFMETNHSETVKEVVKELGLDVKIEDIKDIKKIMEYPILTTPGLVINEKLVVSGRVPTKSEVATFITTASVKEAKA